MKVTPTSIPDVLVLEPKVYQDDRGFFMETYHVRKFTNINIPETFVQDNQSGSKQGTLRGLHYQIKQVQGKLVRSVAGEIFDVAVDLRRKSPTFGAWVGVKLSARNMLASWIPPGFAHGFYVLSEWAEVMYKVTDYYAQEWDRTIRWDDPGLAIEWPLIGGKMPILSKKDARGMRFEEAEVFE